MIEIVFYNASYDFKNVENKIESLNITFIYNMNQ